MQKVIICLWGMLQAIVQERAAQTGEYRADQARPFHSPTNGEAIKFYGKFTDWMEDIHHLIQMNGYLPENIEEMMWHLIEILWANHEIIDKTVLGSIQEEALSIIKEVTDLSPTEVRLKRLEIKEEGQLGALSYWADTGFIDPSRAEYVFGTPLDKYELGIAVFHKLTEMGIKSVEDLEGRDDLPKDVKRALAKAGITKEEETDVKRNSEVV